MATVQIRARIDRNLKKRSDAVLKDLGLDVGSFVSMALTQLVNRRGLPFAVTESDANYFTSEYGLTSAQSAKAGAAMKRETARARRSGKLRKVNELADLAP
ncbi:MAG TPA: type II toxin-antitoxin system RelB/DinJ family antitoxin [Opitutaceae bacterium]|nr:type II toxin-antitoxin system RelB/DinJ family antitoxin [Opitutaceae bacterium]